VDAQTPHETETRPGPAADEASNDFERARSAQRALMPGAARLEALGRRMPVSIAAVHEASAGLSGDMWGLDETGPSRLRVFVADFVGHGIAAAQNTFRLDAFLKSGPARGGGPADFLAAVNAELCDVLPIGQFATMICVDVDLAAARIAIASAAAPPAALAEAQAHGYVDLSGLPLGIRREARHETVELPFPRGARLFLYSDVVTETPDAADPAITPAVLLAELDSVPRAGGPRAVCERIRMRVAEAGAGRLSDDLTLVAIHHREDA
jgi:sigma-B regulation protein RsbU (phosphoserine phosphatase)